MSLNYSIDDPKWNVSEQPTPEEIEREKKTRQELRVNKEYHRRKKEAFNAELKADKEKFEKEKKELDEFVPSDNYQSVQIIQNFEEFKRRQANDLNG